MPKKNIDVRKIRKCITKEQTNESIIFVQKLNLLLVKKLYDVAKREINKITL